VPGMGSYLAEVDLGYSPERLLESLRRKFAHAGSSLPQVNRLVLIYEPEPEAWPALEKSIRELLPAHWTLELWNTAGLLKRVHQHFGIKIEALTPDRMPDLRAAIDSAKGRYAFGAAAANEPLEATLLWQFSHWRLRDIFARTGNKR